MTQHTTPKPTPSSPPDTSPNSQYCIDRYWDQKIIDLRKQVKESYEHLISKKDQYSRNRLLYRNQRRIFWILCSIIIVFSCILLLLLVR